MHTSLSKKLLAGLLSLVMVLSLVAPSMSTNAASKYSLTDKKSVKSGVTFKYQLKGVSKNQYVKVTRNVSGETVKYNKKAVSKTTKVKGTGKTLNFFVTYGEKVANYTGKLTFKVYNKKTNKLAKTLTEKVEVKVPALEITGVEAATYETGTNQVKYLLVTFNKALTSLDASEVSIRRVLDDQLFTVEKVVLATNGKSATITLLGNDQTTATATSYLQPLVDYKLFVNQSNATADMKFNIPAFDNGVVSGYNLEKKSITVNSTPLFVNNLKVDYYDLLGCLVNVKYDADQNLISVVKAETKVVYATLYANKKANTDGTITLNDCNSDATYETQLTTIGSNVATTVATIGDYASGVATAGSVALDTVYPYAKVVLNPNGTVRRIVQMPTTVDYLVRSTTGNYVNVWDNTGVKAEKNLKDFTIIKDNKLADVSAIAAGDMISYSAANHLVVVYTNKEANAIKAVYKNKVTIGDDSLTYGTTGDDLFTTFVVIDDKKTLTGAGITEKELTDVKAGGDVTVYYAFDGSVSFINGTYGEVTTNDDIYLVTKTFSTYSLKNEGFIYGQVSNGKTTLDIDIPVSQLLYVNDLDATATTGDYFVVEAGTGVGTDKAKVELFKDAGNLHEIDLSKAVVKAGELVDIQTNKDGKIIGIYTHATTGLGRAAVEADLDLSKNPAVGGLVTTSATPLFYYNSVKNTVTLTTLGEFNNTTKAIVANSYAYNGFDAYSTTADYIVIADTDITTTATKVATTGKYVIVDIDKFTNSTPAEEVANLYAMKVGTDEVVKFSSFEDATATNLKALTAGDIVEIGFDMKDVLVTSDTKYTLAPLNTAAYSYNATASATEFATSSATSTTLTLGLSTPLTIARHSDADHSTVVYHLKSNGTFELISWDDLVTEANKAAGTLKAVTYNQYQGVTDIVDVIIAQY